MGGVGVVREKLSWFRRCYRKEKAPFRERARLRGGDGRKVTDQARNADFCRELPSFADSALLLGIQACGGRRKPQILQKTEDFRRKRQEPQIGVRHLRRHLKCGPSICGESIAFL